MSANYLEEVEDQSSLIRYPRDYPLKDMSDWSETRNWRIVWRKPGMGYRRENPRFYDAVPITQQKVVQEWKTKPDMRQISIHEFGGWVEMRLAAFGEYYTINYPEEKRDLNAWLAELTGWAQGKFKEIPSEAGRLKSAGGGEEGSQYKTDQEMLDRRAREMLERKQSSEKKVTQGPQEGERNQS